MTAALISALIAGLLAQAPASPPRAEAIVAEFDAMRRVFAERTAPDRMEQILKDPAARAALQTQALADRKRGDELAWELYQADPGHPRLPELLQSRWLYRMRSPATAAPTLAEIDKVLADSKDPRFATDVAFLRAQAILLRDTPKPTAAFLDTVMPAIEAAIARAPRDPRGAGLLYTVMIHARGLPLKTSTELGDRVLADYPDTPIAEQVRKWRTPTPLLGKPLNLEFRDAISGADVSLAALRGKVVVIVFWATWCGPCVREIPRLKELYARHHDRGVAFVGISSDAPPDEGGLDRLRAAVKHHQIPWPQHYEAAPGAVSFSDRCGIKAIPTVFVLDRAGNLASADAGDRLDPILTEQINHK